VVTPYLRECSPSIELDAEMAGTSVRTLQRHLQESGLSYSGLLKDVRYSAAARLLDETDASVLEIALEVSYEDPSHFARAFRRVVGLSPRQFRSRSRVY
jgi:AraC-like DNA-binding protein